MKQVNKHTCIEPTEASNCWIAIWEEVQQHTAYVSKSIKAVEKEQGVFVFHILGDPGAVSRVDKELFTIITDNYSFKMKILHRFWLASIPRLILHYQLALAKFERGWRYPINWHRWWRITTEKRMVTEKPCERGA